MSLYTPDSSGIFSLSGFSYQIRVFVLYMLKLKEGMQIEFETIEDVNMRKIKKHNELDDFEENFINRVVSNDTNIAIQVKRTNISDSSALHILLNWVLLESSEYKITKYVLFTDDEYGNIDILFSKSALEQFKNIKESTKGTKATITKVKKKFSEFDELVLSPHGRQ
ncbi:hypothetical protein [Paenibacillus lautus]|uniref:hypothetical protein n=1 Tax=Paenibacillus lautus TaxID=1401 RepID=UPI001C7CA954|nr:hypothetical protein [Paenibacillus lautus]MBX4147274.1 hypothetical protein [Paenibacillus lautus]